ncbi:class I adenylate-forming enzyme family protein [Sphingomonas naphthae]|uniref:Class I adenylate-forming enzyme family protein n=1 Tax=Sphingomonas naphthae TaxID=1813468 RepID=A0ABY7TJ22_9SPHN|nr:class I adenylate-forming enzyme family protein [Sphingomonas naphthae]WCT73033.1 class I adenylate-forming enzyme family protein [Sphingomonas naphthae]
MAEEIGSGTGARPSIIHGLPLAEEQGLGALTLGGYLREVATRYADNEALVMHEAGGVTRWSYAELWAEAVAVARALVACGVGKGTRVGVLMTNRPEWLSATFGTALAGGVAVGLSTFSTPAELVHLLKDSACSVVLLERHVLKKDFAAILADLVPEIATAAPGAVESLAFPFLRHLAMTGPGAGDGAGAIEGWAAFLKRGQAVPESLIDATAATVAPADPGLLFFSSGSTSKPKGILNAHRGVCLQLWRWRRIYNIAEPLRCWSANGFFWSGNFAQGLGGTLSSGGSLVLQSTFAADEALRLMEMERVTMPVCWPHQSKQLADAPSFAATDLSALKFVGRDTPLGRHPTVATDWQEPVAAYGNTETFTISSIFPSGTPVARINRSHGEPQPGNAFKIVDPITGAVVPMGERGEIAVKGPTLMLGYIGVPLDETLDGEGFFRTGDGGYVDEGNRLYWEGRLTDIIKTGGANVSPLEIDEVIAACPGVKISMTVGVPHETLGEIVVACVIPFAGEAPSDTAIRDFAKQKLASYKVPRRILFFREEEFATTGSNKIKSSELRKLAAARLEGADLA